MKHASEYETPAQTLVAPAFDAKYGPGAGRRMPRLLRQAVKLVASAFAEHAKRYSCVQPNPTMRWNDVQEALANTEELVAQERQRLDAKGAA